MQYDKRQLLKDAFDLKETFKVPTGFWHHFVLGPDQFRADTDPAIRDRIVEGHRKYYQLVNPDMMKMMNEGFMGYPPIMDNPLETEEDLLRIKAVGPDHPWITEQVKHVQRIIEQFNGEVMTFYNVFAPLQAIRIKFDFLDMRFDKFVKLAEKYPKAFSVAGMEIQKDFVSLIEQLFTQTDLDGIYYCVQNIQSPIYTKDLYRKLIRPTEIEVLNAANKYSRYNILHICGYARHTNVLSFYQDYEAGCYNWAQHTEKIPLSEGAKLFPGKCILGGFDNNPGTLIDRGDDEALERYTKQLIDENGYRGFILGADCSIPNDIDDRRVRVITDAAQKYVNPNMK